MKLEDGKGTGVLAQVDASHRIQVASVASDRAEAANIDKDAFILATEIQLVGAAAEHKTFYLSNGEASRDLLIDIEKFSSDGGTTSNTKPVFVKCYLNASVPTANDVLKDPIGTNTATGQSSTDFVVWDGAATGFTQASPGDLISTFVIGLGTTDSRIPSKFIIGPAKTLTYSFECEEACKVSMQVYVHLL